MLLIIFLGLFAKLAFVCGDCDVGDQEVNNFDFTMFSASRVWYMRYHTPNILDNILDCVNITYGIPEGNKSTINVNAHTIIAQIPVKINGYAKNWDSTGHWEEIYQPQILSGKSSIIAVDYDRYYILEYTTFFLDITVFYVAYRSQNPDNETVTCVLEQLQKNDIDVNQLAVWPDKHC